METKTIATAIIVLLAAIVAAYVLMQPPAPGPAPPQDRGDEVEYIQYFIDNAVEANDVHIVMDLRGSEGKARANIMQCGIDLAAGSGLVSKTLHVYSFEGGICTTQEGEMPIADCINELQAARTAQGHVIFYAEKGDSVKIYEQELLIGVNESYEYKDCSVNLVVVTQTPDETGGRNVTMPPEGDLPSSPGPEIPGNETEGGLPEGELPLGPGPEILPGNESAANESG